MDGILRFCGIAVLGLSAVLLLREKHPAFAFFCGASVMIVTAIQLCGSSVGSAVEAITDAAENTAFSGYVGILLRALGIGYISAFTAEICRSAGENLLAGAAVIAGKAELILLCVPMITGLLDVAATLL